MIFSDFRTGLAATGGGASPFSDRRARFDAAIFQVGGCNTFLIGETGTIAAGDVASGLDTGVIFTSGLNTTVLNEGLVLATVKTEGQSAHAIWMTGNKARVHNAGTILSVFSGV